MVDEMLAEPVARLLALGEPTDTQGVAWLDYRSYGIGPEHIAALIQVATNLDLLHLSDESDPSAWGPIHAWRCLAQLQAEPAIRPLIQLFHQIEDNDWVIEEMPDVFAMIGAAAFHDLAVYLDNSTYPAYARLVAATSLMQMALADPSLREQSIEAIARQLEGFCDNSPGMNGVLIANLLELEAVEQAELIHRVFTEGKVDRFIAGDWRDAKKRLRYRPSPRK